MESLSHRLSRYQLPYKIKILIQLFSIIIVFVFLLFSINLLFIKYNLNWNFHNDFLNVHLIPHSHDDVGWLRTPESYYNAYVRFILNNVIIELQKNKKRRFVYAEVYFFWKWWLEQDSVTKKIVKKLIKNKQLEIINGGICMSDEAVTHYQSFIDQLTWGLRFINDTFGSNVKPTVAWQIDTFGHSKIIALLFHQMGFDSLFINRIDIEEIKLRRENKLMEFLWVGNISKKSKPYIFTSLLFNHYSSPPGFDFERIEDDIYINFSAFSIHVRKQAESFKTNHILVPMGDDFRFVNAKRYFKYIDRLISYFDKHSNFKLKVFYSTPSLYLQKLHASQMSWPLKFGDFFPYASEINVYWSGYFTSRPTLKYFERLSNNFLQISKQLLVLANKGMIYFDQLRNLREAVAVMQHHDAITGTAQQHVTNHYAKLLYQGIHTCAKPINSALKYLSMLNSNYSESEYVSCLLLNISSCQFTETHSQFVVTVYNPLSRITDYYVRIPVDKQSYLVLGNDGAEITSQMVAISKTVRNIPGRKSKAKSELVFKASNLPPLGFKSFYVVQSSKAKNNGKVRENYENPNVKAIFNGSQLQMRFATKNDLRSLVSQRMEYYESRNRWSGAYLFSPIRKSSFNLKNKKITKLFNDGPIVKEYEQIFSEWVSQIVRIYKDEDYVEYNWLIGPIPVKDFVGKEVFATYESQIQSENVYYTDVNGMKMEKRIRNYRYYSKKPLNTVAGNYYPVTSSISIQDDFNQMAVVVDRPQGGSSLKSGQIELMIHRRTIMDDGYGVGEPLNEIAHGKGLVVRGSHWLLFGSNNSEMKRRVKLFAQEKHLQPWLFFFDASSLSYEDWRSNHITEFSGISADLPSHIQILTLEPWREDAILLRLENTFEDYSPSENIDNAEMISLKELFKNFEVIDVRETALGADRWLSDVKRLKWNSYGTDDNNNREEINDGKIYDNFRISLKPQQIRTFIVKISEKTTTITL